MTHCPICDKASDEHYTPFCSKRCEQVDLGKWLTGRYAVPVVEMDDTEEEAPEDNSDLH